MKKEIEQEKDESNQYPYKGCTLIRNDTSLAKINSNLYNEVAEIVEVNNIDYPSIKNFIEVAIRNQLNLIRYDIQNREEILTRDGNLKHTKNEFTHCLACNKMFLNEKTKNKEGKRICPKCTQLIKNLNKLVD